VRTKPCITVAGEHATVQWCVRKNTGKRTIDILVVINRPHKIVIHYLIDYHVTADIDRMKSLISLTSSTLVAYDAS